MHPCRGVCLYARDVRIRTSIDTQPLLSQCLGILAELVVLIPFLLVILEGILVVAMDGHLLALTVFGADDGISDTAIVLRVVARQQRTAVLARTGIAIAGDGLSALRGIVLDPVRNFGLSEETDDLFVPKGEESLFFGVSSREILWHNYVNLV